MPTLILTPRQNDDTRSLRTAAADLGWDVVRLNGWRPPPELRDADPVPYGEPLFVAAVCQFLGLVPLELPFDWLSGLAPDFLARSVRSISLADIDSVEFPAFVKPADDKCFPAKVYQARGDFQVAEAIPETLPVIVSEPVEWALECRAHIRDGEVVSVSPYSRHGDLAQGEDGGWDFRAGEKDQALEFLACLTDDLSGALPPGIVIDVGMLGSGQWAVVESNPCWGAGIYGGDPREICRILERAVHPEEGLPQELKQWVVQRTEQQQ